MFWMYSPVVEVDVAHSCVFLIAVLADFAVKIIEIEPSSVL